MHPLLLVLLLMVQESSLPMKAADEFKIELDYKFKPRPFQDNTSVDLNEVESTRDRRSGSSPLPYLNIHISFLKLSDKEVRIQCNDNNGKNRMSRKIEINKPYKLDMGYTDDMKDRVTAYEYTFMLLDDEKKGTSQIVLKVEEDGTFLVNGTKRGKF